MKIRFGPNTDEHDLNFKLKHARRFLEEGHKVKAFVFFKGRTIVFKERGEYMLLKFAQELEDIGVVESMPKLEGKRWSMYLNIRRRRSKFRFLSRESQNSEYIATSHKPQA